MNNYDKDIADLIGKQEQTKKRFEAVKKAGGLAISLAAGCLSLNIFFNINADPEKYEALSGELEAGTLVVPRPFFIPDLVRCVRDKVWLDEKGVDVESIELSDEQADDLVGRFPERFKNCVGGDLPATQDIKENYVNQYAPDNTFVYMAIGSVFAGAGFILSGALGGALKVSSTNRSIKEKQDMQNLLK
jgi:hypothetical protein